MAPYVNSPFNHLAAIQRWATETGAEAVIDVRDLTMEVKHRGRYYRMYPLFQGQVNGLRVHLPQLTPDVRGFGGWRPYQGLTHPHSTDKQLFKAWLQECELPCPAGWDFRGEPPAQDYVLKARSGSFGRGLFGPYRGGATPASGVEALASHGDLFAEQFVQGRILKVWFWGAKPFFAHMQDYPTIQGDGKSAVRDLLQSRIKQAGLHWDTLDQKPVVLDCLAFQHIGLDDILAEGQRAWIDYRYSQVYAPPAASSPVSDDRLEQLAAESGDQVQRMGAALARLLQPTVLVPVIITVDGLLDAQGRIWWLEMNTNSLLPPEGYATMFADLFG